MIRLNITSTENKTLALAALLFPVMAYFQHWTMITVSLILLTLSLINIKNKQYLLNKDNRLIIFAFIFLFVAAIPNAIMDSLYIGKLQLAALDVPSRYLAGAILLLGLSKLKLTIEHLFLGVFIGLAGAFLLYPFWGSYILGLTRYYNGYPSFENLSIDVLAVAYISIVFMMSALIATLYFIHKKQNKFVILAIISANLASVIMMQSGSKVALLAYPLILVLIVMVWKKTPKKTLLLLLTPIITATLIFSMPKLSLNNDNNANNIMQQRLFSDLSNMDGLNSTTLRLSMWKGAWQSFVDSPILGQGYEERVVFHNQLVEQGVIPAKVGKGKDSVHNELFNTLAKKGLLGLTAITLLYLLPLIVFYRASKANPNNFYASLNGVFIIFSFVVIGFTEAPLMGTFTSTFYILAITFAYLSLESSQSELAKTENNQEQLI